VCLSTINNPTGGAVAKDAFMRLLKGLPSRALLVVDEAYFEFGREQGLDLNGLELLQRYCTCPWICLRTFAKAYSFAGARIGYAIFSTPTLASAMFKVKGVFPVNTLAQVGAVALMKEEDYMRACVRRIISERNKMAQELESLGCTVLPSYANFLMFSWPHSGVQEFWEALRLQGVLVTPMGTIAGVADNAIRMTMCTEEANAEALRVIRELVPR